MISLPLILFCKIQLFQLYTIVVNRRSENLSIQFVFYILPY
nr:MAG TPA: hypothetical protein [Caudoviricetes sp.]